jgi:type I restriction enzyme M protein
MVSMTGRDKLYSSYDAELLLINEKIIPYLRNLGYNRIERNFVVNLGSKTIEIDAVVFLDNGKQDPFIVVEVKQNIRSVPSLLDPAVQQAFSAAISLGDTARYLLVTDGDKYYWFERIPENQSLTPLQYPPERRSISYQQSLFDDILISVTDPEQYRNLMREVVDVLRKEGLSFGIRMSIELNRIIIAKIHDEKINANRDDKDYRFSSRGKNLHDVSQRIKSLYQEAISTTTRKVQDEGIWHLSPQALLSSVRILEPYIISSVSQDVIDRTFWTMFPTLLRRDEGAYTTPLPLAAIVAQLARPKLTERIIDPACGTGLLLLESIKYLKNQILRSQDLGNPPDNASIAENTFGIEINSEVAELAATNFVINGLSYTGIINTDSLNIRKLNDIGVRVNDFDVVISNPPFGVSLTREAEFIRDYETANLSSKITIETLFLELSIKLLRPNGRLVLLIPDGLLSSPQYTPIRSWLLKNTTNRAIISLPPETFAIAGHSGKASILLLEKRSPSSDQEMVLIVDVKNIGYDRLGQPTRENDIPELLDIVHQFQETGKVVPQLDENKMRSWSVPIGRLRSERLDVSHLDPQGEQLLNALSYGSYPVVKLEQVAEILSGRNFKTYVESDQDTALVIQAGAVRDLELSLNSPQFISRDDYYAAGRGRLQKGDVLVTTTGQYLGRAAVVELTRPAVASGAVTILRPTQQIDPFFLAAVLSSKIGKSQIYRMQASATAQPYIRRSDLGQVRIPLPPLEVQKELAYQIISMLADARDLQRKAVDLETRARDLVVAELLNTQSE